MSELQLTELVRRQSRLLDEVFGEGTYEIVEAGPEACELRTDWVEVTLVYDGRDQWVSAQLKPLSVPDDLSDSYPDHSWLKFCGIDVDATRKSALDDQQVTYALRLIQPVVALFKDAASARDAFWFVRGYSHAYADWASGHWD